MGSATLTPCYDTYIDMTSSTAVHDTDTQLYFGTLRLALFQFLIPEEARSAKITSAYLIYNVTEVEYLASGAVKYYVCSADKQLQNIAYGNMRASFGSSYYKQAACTAGQNSQEISSALTNNIYNGYFTIFLSNADYPYNYISSSESSNPPTLLIFYESVAPSAPTLVSPINTFIEKGNPIEFKWNFNAGTAYTQQSYSLEYKKVSDTTYTVISGTGSSNTYTLQSGTLDLGTYDWRVKTTDTDSMSSKYASSQFTIKGKPAIPIITETANKALTTIKWNAEEQIGVRAKLVKDDETIWQFDRNIQQSQLSPDVFLENGTYVFYLSVLNKYGYWSDETSKQFTINATAPTAGTINAMQANGIVTVSTTFGTYIAYLYRKEDNNKELIAKLTADNTTYIDREVKHNTAPEYVLRVYDGTGYADTTCYDCTVVTIKGFELDNVENRITICTSMENYQKHTENLTKDILLSNYSGIVDPVAEINDYVSRQITRSGYIAKDDYQKLLAIFYSNNPLIYKDSLGNVLNCVITSLTVTNAYFDRGYEVNITISKVKKEEVTIYD